MFSSIWKKQIITWVCLVTLGASVSFGEDLAPYQLTAKNGPWLIMTAVFADYDSQAAQNKAIELVKEFRAARIDAYVFVKNSGDSQVVSGTPYWVYDEENPEVAPTLSNRYSYRNPGAQVEYAVLIGNYPSLEDNRAAKMLAKVRTMQPRCMVTTKNMTHPLYQMVPQRNTAPLSRAFIVANPLLPREQFVSSGLDPVVVAANRDVKKYSLLDCPGTYTVQVAVLKGVTTLNQQKIAEIQRYESREISVRGQTLSDADEKAILLCEGLRAKGYEAYVFRDHYSSIVTVGSFNEVGSQQNGQFVVRPEIMDIFQKFSASCDPSKGLAGITRKTLAEIPGGKSPKAAAANILFDVTPKVVVVPRRSVFGAR